MWLGASPHVFPFPAAGGQSVSALAEWTQSHPFSADQSGCIPALKGPAAWPCLTPPSARHLSSYFLSSPLPPFLLPHCSAFPQQLSPGLFLRLFPKLLSPSSLQQDPRRILYSLRPCVCLPSLWASQRAVTLVQAEVGGRGGAERAAAGQGMGCLP